MLLAAALEMYEKATWLISFRDLHIAVNWKPFKKDDEPDWDDKVRVYTGLYFKDAFPSRCAPTSPRKRRSLSGTSRCSGRAPSVP